MAGSLCIEVCALDSVGVEGQLCSLRGLWEELNNKHGAPYMVGVWYTFWMVKSGLLTKDRGFLKDNKG